MNMRGSYRQIAFGAALFLGLATGLAPRLAADESVGLSTLDLSRFRQGWGTAQADKSVQGKDLIIGGKKFEKGVGTHAQSMVYIDLKGGAKRFTAQVGVDDEVNGNEQAAVVFRVYGDDRKLWESPLMHAGNAPQNVDVDVTGVKTLLLYAANPTGNINFGHADWAEANFIVTGEKPVTIAAPAEEAVVLTPPPGPGPRINGPKIYGVRPGHPFLYRIPCTGTRPIKFAAKNLPDGLTLNEDTGIITGTTPTKGDYAVTLAAENASGRAERVFKIVAGETLSLTPQMGFNDWYAYYNRVTDAKMRQAADAMVASGMADAGYQYVNIDDCWMGKRDAAGNITGNEKFPDMKGLADYIHGKGLKAGLYTSPGPKTCAGYTGALRHEARDAKQFAAWGFDFLKYDWCSYKAEAPGLEGFQKPYRLMGDLLKQQDRDMVFNLCQYGMGDVWKWGKQVDGHSWRTGGDLGFELHRIVDIALGNSKLGEFNGPGGWNDPDYIQIGWIGDASRMGEVKPCPLTPNEQYSFMSLWCLLPAPLFYSGDMTHLDAFTLNILTNAEVIDIDQDALGQCARPALVTGDSFVLIRNLEDGSKAVGLCNRGLVPASVSVDWPTLGVTGKQIVRDLWRQKDLGKFEGQFTGTVPPHGVLLLRIRAAN
jgi:alpha-galactosidase